MVDGLPGRWTLNAGFPADSRRGIRVYGTVWCGQCHLAKAVFARYGVPFEWIDIESDSEAAAFVRGHNRGMRSVPTIIFPDGSILVEPSARTLQAKIDELRAKAIE